MTQMKMNSKKSEQVRESRIHTQFMKLETFFVLMNVKIQSYLTFLLREMQIAPPFKVCARNQIHQ